MQPLIITVALSGNNATKEKTPFVPITVHEIADDACRCYEAGARVVHIHVRDDNGLPSQDPKLYQQVIKLIRKKGCPIICQTSLAGGETTRWEMADILKINPQTAGLGAGSINRLDRLNCFEPRFIEYMAKEMKQRKIAPEMEIFDVSMIYTVMRLQKQGVLPETVKYNLGLGAPGLLPGTVEMLTFMKNCLPSNALWGVTAVGPQHHNLTAITIALGGHARVGIEDYFYDENGRLASNEQHTRWAANMAALLGRPIATIEETKQLMGIALN